jgi:hypothetical protein
MKVELKNVKICDWMSEETTCFTASVWIDGKKAGTVENTGKGGCNSYFWNQQPVKGQEFEKWARTLPPCDSQYGPLPMDADLYISDLLDAWETAKLVKKHTKKGCIVFRCTGDDRGAFRLVDTRGNVANAEKWVRSTYENLEEIHLPA